MARPAAAKRQAGSKRRRQQRRRPTEEEAKARARKHRAAFKAQRRRETAAGLAKACGAALPNRVSPHLSQEEEAAERTVIVARFLDAIRPQLPALLQTLSAIDDFRDPKKVEHQLGMVLLYGILCFLLHSTSRREANRELTGPVLREHLKEQLHEHFPQLEKLPHQDTVNRVLSGIDVEKIAEAHLGMIRRLVRNKKFERFLIAGRYPVAIDGTQKQVSRKLLSPQWQERTINKGKDSEETQYYVYVLEASLAFANGLTIPLMSEFLEYTKGDRNRDKQDCETRAFHRLAKRLKAAFPRLPLIILLDGLYSNGPIFERCRSNGWGFMIVLKDNCLPATWAEFHGLSKLEEKNQLDRTWGNRRQTFRWVNAIEHTYGESGKKRQILHVVECTETWKEIDPNTLKTVALSSHHAWVSSEPLTKGNVHERCNLAARHRWNIEEEILVEKRHGYQYEHRFSENWQAMKGYHYLMRLAHTLNVLAHYSAALIDFVRQKGVRGIIKLVRDSLTNPWLSAVALKEALAVNPQLRLE